MEDVTGRNLAIRRLTAIWALNECALGGILHATQIPFKGLIIGGFAVIIISLICVLSQNIKKSIVMSLLIVLSIKFLLSPHTSPTAYFAVAFQGFAGIAIFSIISNRYIAAMLLAVLAMLQSAFQKIIVLTLIFGTSIWEAVDIWGKWIGDQTGIFFETSSSVLLISFYLGVYFTGGIIIGHVAGNLTRDMFHFWEDSRYKLILNSSHQMNLRVVKTKRKNAMYVVFTVLLLLILLSFLIVDDGDFALWRAIVILARVIGILFFWYAIIAPWIVKKINHYFSSRHGMIAEEIKETLSLLPYIAWIVRRSWREARTETPFKRFSTFFTLSIMYVLFFTLDSP